MTETPVRAEQALAALCALYEVVGNHEVHHALLRRFIVQHRGRTEAEEGGRGWVALFDADDTLAVDEGETYLFAVPVSTNGAPPRWEYFIDAVVWDAETEADWSDGEHGWGLLGEIWFRPLPPPPPESK